MSDIIFDASAILALLQQETGHERVGELLLTGPCAICTVNLAEVITRLVDNGMGFDDACAAANLPNLRPQPFDTVLAQIAASLRPITRPLGLSLADRACVALARASNDVNVFTADTSWKNIVLPNVSIQIIR